MLLLLIIPDLYNCPCEVSFQKNVNWGKSDLETVSYEQCDCLASLHSVPGLVATTCTSKTIILVVATLWTSFTVLYLSVDPSKMIV